MEELASVDKVVLGSIGFAVFWVLAVFPSVPVLPVGRTAGSLLGAALMVVARVLTPEQAYSAVDLSVLGLLFGTMLVGLYLERAGAFVHLGRALSWRSRGPKDLLCRIALASAISSALFTNDTTCVVLTGFVLAMAKESRVPPHPFLLALASGANIGSAATPIGNPQNLIIAVQSRISFGQFLLGIFPAMIVGVAVNTLILLGMFWKTLSVVGEEETPSDDVVVDVVENDVDVVENIARWKTFASKVSVYFVTIGMLAALLVGLNMSWTVITASLILVVLDFKDAGPNLDKVSYSILVLFCGMFITVEGFNQTGIPSTLWNITKPHAKINNVSGLVVLSLVILVLSNVASNVPTVLLLGGRVAAQAAAISSKEEKRAWLVLAWVSTVAGLSCQSHCVRASPPGPIRKVYSLLLDSPQVRSAYHARRDRHWPRSHPSLIIYHLACFASKLIK